MIHEHDDPDDAINWPRAMCCDETEHVACDEYAECDSGLCRRHEQREAGRLFDALPEEWPDNDERVMAARKRVHAAEFPRWRTSWVA